MGGSKKAIVLVGIRCVIEYYSNAYFSCRKNDCQKI